MAVKVENLYDGSFWSNCYLVYDETSRKAAIVDPSADAGRIAQTLADRGLSLSMILLTHGHFDHIVSADSLRDATGAPLFVHPDDADCLTDPKKSCFYQFMGADRVFRPAEKFVSDGEQLSCGQLKFRVVHTPGHTKGSVCYIVENVVFTGDTVFADDFGRTDLPGGSEKDMRESIQKLAALFHASEGVLTTFPGHGGSGDTGILSEARFS